MEENIMTTFDIAAILNNNGYHAEATESEVWAAVPFTRHADIISLNNYRDIEEMYVDIVCGYGYRIPRLDKVKDYIVNRIAEIYDEEIAAITTAAGVTDPLFHEPMTISRIKADYKKRLDKWQRRYRMFSTNNSK